jgi:hypothetical protein
MKAGIHIAMTPSPAMWPMTLSVIHVTTNHHRVAPQAIAGLTPVQLPDQWGGATDAYVRE